MEQNIVEPPSTEAPRRLTRSQPNLPAHPVSPLATSGWTPINPKRGYVDADTHFHPEATASPPRGGTGTQEFVASSPRPLQNTAEGGPDHSGGPSRDWRKNGWEPSPAQERENKARKRPGGMSVSPDEKKKKKNKQKQQQPAEPTERYDYDQNQMEWEQQDTERDLRYALAQEREARAIHYQQQRDMQRAMQNPSKTKGAQGNGTKKARNRNPKARSAVHPPPELVMVDGPEDGTEVRKLLRRIEAQARIVRVKEENMAWETYDGARADQPHLQGSPLSKKCKEDEFLIFTENSLLCEACSMEIPLTEGGPHCRLTSHMVKVGCIREERAWLERVYNNETCMTD